MTTHLAIDDELINEAQTLGHFKTKEDTVVTALKEFINRRKQLEFLSYLVTLILTQIMITRRGGILESIGRYYDLWPRH
ncbi:hypothetical protein METHB2_1000003 [Candidatus Methylobacter favarea]|uniref:Type II toxin-antitoxin system VapB family antitoxin n=1 Tax=Candidatus Methylobacter favarea TaxID=2707345 RepID=A0A8S0WY55_9GAMM|nr:type II toxin-antitoxin system VapB family antitoxin [Candidatus Methylobacter favarea]CAA9889433.1 hypothetical protein METHB2_1000003 [Candidatus Methylobacter favarea]